jgi:hypothetical protein
MRLKLHDDVEGHKSGETVEVPEERAKWLLENGYASQTGRDADGVHATSVEAKLDPTLAENRKDKPERDLAERMAEGLGTPGSAKPDPREMAPKPYLDRPNPIELTNGKGDPAKAANGKEALEARAEKADPEDAVENDPAAAEEQREENDKAEAKVEKLEEKKADAETTEEAAEIAAKVAKRRRA